MTNMLYSVLDTVKIMGWMGVVLLLLTLVNTTCKTVYNVSVLKQSFSWKKMLKGLARTGLFYVSALFVGIAFTMLPFVNEMITSSFGTQIISNEMLKDLSGVGVLGTCLGVIINQGTKAFEGIKKLGEVKSDNEEITWTVEEE